MLVKYSFINFKMLFKVLGFLLLIEAAFMVIPIVVSLCYAESDVLQLLVSCGVMLAAGGLLVRLRPRNREMRKREAILLTGLTWVVLSLFGLVPFMICSPHMTLTDAFFETMSGFTTTGASLLDFSHEVSHGILMWRSVIQWIGGMGIILFTLAVVPMLNYQGGIQLFNAEVTGITQDKLRPRVSNTAKSLWLVYLCLTIAIVVFLSFSDMNFFDAFCFGLSTMSTGGFATPEMTAIAENSLYVRVVVVLFMFLGGVNFSILYRAALGEFRYAMRNDALKWYVGIVLVAYAILCINLVLKGMVHNVGDLTIDPLFQSVSIISSTGFTEPDFAEWGSMAVIIMVLMMFTGACAGSTSGGAKLDRIIVLVKFIKNEFYKIMHPNAVTTICMNGKGTPNMLVAKVLSFLFLYILVILVGGSLLSLYGVPLSESFFTALSAISNTSIDNNSIGIECDFLTMPIAAKWTLAFIMLIGRLELYTILLWFTPVFWKK